MKNPKAVKAKETTTTLGVWKCRSCMKEWDMVPVIKGKPTCPNCNAVIDIGEEEANKITRKATSRGTDLHTLVEDYLHNRNLSDVQPISEHLFKIAKPALNRINNIYALEGSLYSQYLGVAGTVDCIAEFDGELSIIDFKTSKQPKPREWIDGYFVQCCAYACMLHELTGLSVKKL